MITRLALAIATVGGVGYAPVAPGTFGSAAGILVWWFLPHTTSVQALAIAGIFAIGVWSSHLAEKYFQRTDPGHVVIDEVVGVLITLFMNPVATWKGVLAAFLLFRIADIVKPFPSGKLESLHGGLGVMADDAMAAVYSNLALRAMMATLAKWVIW